MNGRDPGWKPALRLYARGLLPWNHFRRKTRRPVLNPLTTFRLIWLSLLISLFLFYLVLSFVIPWGDDGGPFVWVIPLLGISLLVVVWVMRNQPLDTSSEQALMSSFVTRFYVSFALSETTAMFAFVFTFMREARWLYLLGLPFTVAGLFLCGPLQANIERYDRMLRTSGTPLRLSTVLMTPGPPDD